MRVFKGLVTIGVMALLLTGCVTVVPMDHAGDPAMPMDHGAMTDDAAMPMDHGAMMDDPSMPFDAQFIDGMIVHHEGAVVMAEEALERAERPELRAMAEEIVAAQGPEIEQMRSWRNAWYPDLAESAGMDMPMGDMEVSADESIPYDQRFMQAMISHHEGAIAMAEAALVNAENEELRILAEAIIAAQQIEIDQMRLWLEEWFEIAE
jgi:uncharacterized protein (DUF305 family)